MNLKPIILLITLSTSVLIASCKKENSLAIDRLSDLTQEVISQPTLQELKQAQALLSVPEREILWRTKLNFILTNKNERFTSEQRKIVLQIKEVLLKNGIATLLKHPEIGATFLRNNLPYFSNHFNKAQLNILIESPYLNDGMTISNFDDTMIAPLVAVAPSSNCTCKYDLGCPGLGNYCEVRDCHIDDNKEMCGLFGTESCRERCTGTQPDIS